MSVRIRYMGNKREMAADVAELIDDLRPGQPILDLFSGMCWIAGALAPSSRPVWVNDIQRYASLAASCLVASPAAPPDCSEIAGVLDDAFARNRQALERRFASELDKEAHVVDSPTLHGYAAGYRAWRHAANCPGVAAEVAELAARPTAAPYRLCTLTFAWGYFGLRQALDLDSLRYAIDLASRRGDLAPADRRWTLLALVQAASRLATGSGHMAQYLNADNDASLARVITLRRRDARRQFLTELGLLAPFGDADWRAGNRVLRSDALNVRRNLRRHGFADAVVYADPPYSKNQYSRFYHVLETVTRYDYPPAIGRGRYRPDRFGTPFSTATGVVAAFDRLAAGVAATGSTLVLSYPSQGMLSTRGTDPNTVLSRHFGSVSLELRRPARHSSLGARHGAASAPVDEMVYVAR